MFFLHANIVCSDFDRSLDFYTRVMGGTALQINDDDGTDLSQAMGYQGTSGYRVAMIHWDNSRHGPYLDLLEWHDKGNTGSRSAKDTGLARLAFRVDDLDETVAKLEADGVQLNAPPNFGQVGRWGVKVAFFNDPDGVLLEVVQVLKK